jgi:hypothetical protein
MISMDFHDRETTAVLADWVVGDAGIELMTIATWHPFETRRRIADLARETISPTEFQTGSRAHRKR